MANVVPTILTVDEEQALNLGAPRTGWQPKYYVVCAPRMYFPVSNQPVARLDYDPDYSGIYTIADTQMKPDEFAMALRDDAITVDPKPLEAADRPLEVTIRGDCYIFFFLSSLNWQFRRGDAAITVKKGETKYTDLYHVPSYGPPTAQKNAPIDGCKVAYFSTAGVYALNTFRDPFNLYVEFIQDGALIEVKIDPDIKNTGDPGNWP